MATSITVPEQWNIETAVGRYDDTDFQFTYATEASQSLDVTLRGTASDSGSVTYTLSVSSGRSEDQIVVQTADEDTAMAATEFLLCRLTQAIQQGTLPAVPSETDLEPVVDRTARRFDYSLIGRFFSIFRLPSC